VECARREKVQNKQKQKFGKQKAEIGAHGSFLLFAIGPHVTEQEKKKTK
jgi:hypothetical protein